MGGGGGVGGGHGGGCEMAEGCAVWLEIEVVGGDAMNLVNGTPWMAGEVVRLLYVCRELTTGMVRRGTCTSEVTPTKGRA